MEEQIQALFADRESGDSDASYRALKELFSMTEEPVDWAYDVWDRLLEDLEHKEGSVRAFTSQLLTRLAVSDPEGRMLEDFPKVAAVMRDEKTVTARHTVQSLWRIGLAGEEQRAMVVEELAGYFDECASEKRGRIFRRDVLEGLGRLASATDDESIEGRAEALIESEQKEKERKKLRAAWREGLG